MSWLEFYAPTPDAAPPEARACHRGAWHGNCFFSRAMCPQSEAGTSSTPSPQMGPGTSSTPSSQMGTMSTRDTINATVADVNHQHKTVKLKMQGGETVEFKVHEASLTNLNKGDSVQVSIRKAEGQSGMSTQPAQPAQPARPARPESGTKSQ